MDEVRTISQQIGLRFGIVTIFPDFFESVFRYGIVARALKTGLATVDSIDLRTFTTDRHRTVDDRPFGGGEGMVMKPEPLFAAVESLDVASKITRNRTRETVILLSAQGERFTQSIAHQLASLERVILLCGRYEGVDERVAHHLADRELSIGDYVLSGGELGAAIIIDAVIRLLPGALGNPDSAHYESFGAAKPTHTLPPDAQAPPLAVSSAAGLLDYPHYTRPADFRGLLIPQILAEGDHAAIRAWRREQALTKTFHQRPDLLAEAPLSPTDRKILERLRNPRSLP